METEQCFSKSIIIYYTQTSFMKSVYFSVCRAIVTHPDQWKIVKLQIEKGIYDHAPFR